MGEPDYAAERRLPVGTTCADCQHGPRCDGLFGAVRKQFTACDFWPSRYIERRLQEGGLRLVSGSPTMLKDEFDRYAAETRA